MDILNELLKYTGKENILINEPLKNHTTFKIGGEAMYIVTPSSIDEITGILKFLKTNNILFFILGNGSNILVKDEGFPGVVVKLGAPFSAISADGEKIIANAGVTLKKISNLALEHSLSGFEELSGIPGTLGGAIYMNAGAYQREIKDVLESVTYLDNDFNLKTENIENITMKYRETLFSEKNFIVLGATLKLNNGNKEKIAQRIREVTKMRTDKQPLSYPSAGSTFKRPVGHFAGKLIEDAGLKGYTVGGAMVSEKHAGFVINFNNATCQDVLNLTEDVKKIIKEKFGVELELEVKVI